MALNSRRVHLPYKTVARSLIQECDIILFRGKRLRDIPIKIVTGSAYSHVGLASWRGETLQCLHFQIGVNGEAVNLSDILNRYDDRVDIYRLATAASTRLMFDKNTLDVNPIVTYNEHVYPRDITDYFREIIKRGQGYGYLRLLKMLQFYFPLCRVGDWDDTQDTERPLNLPVCSTAVSHVFSHFGVDLLHNRADDRMSPGDIALSPLLSYLFTLKLTD